MCKKTVIAQYTNIKKRFTLHNLWLAMVLVSVLVGTVGVAKLAKEKLFIPASASISFTYSNASHGLNPDGTRLDPYRIISDDVVEAAEKELGYSIDKSEVWVRPLNASSTNYATDYTLYYKGKHRDQVLKAILNAWAEDFNARYSTYQIEQDQAPDSLDYIELAQWVSNEADKLSETAKKGMKEDNVWKDEDSSETFKDAYDTAENIKNVDVANFKTYLIQNGITKDSGALKASITYKDKLLANKKALFDAQYQNRQSAIELYDPTLFPTISVPSISNSGRYYVTTTKTGLDDIYEAAASFSSQSLDVQKMISEDQALIANMSGSSSKEQCAEAEKMYQAIQGKLTELSKKINSLDSAYVEQKKKPFFSIRIGGKVYAPEVPDANQ